MASGSRLTKVQRHALVLLQRHQEDAYVHGGHETFLDSGQVAMGWRTAYALHRRGLVNIEETGDPDGYAAVTLTDLGSTYGQ